MSLSIHRAGQLVAIALIATVVTQILYVALEVNGDPAIAWPIWRSEAFAFLAVAILGFAWVREWPLVAAGLVVGGILNVIQVGMGLWMFDALFTGGEAEQAVGAVVLALSFFLYFAGKVAFAISGIALGALAWRSASGWPRIAGILAGLAGIAALATNLYAMGAGREIVFIAGACGTASTLFLALALGALRPARG